MRDALGRQIKVYTNWHGGHNYAWAVCEDDFEEFDYLYHAENAFHDRRFANDPYYPAVDDTSYMDIYLRDDDGAYLPYCRFTIGPRGGILKEMY